MRRTCGTNCSWSPLRSERPREASSSERRSRPFGPHTPTEPSSIRACAQSAMDSRPAGRRKLVIHHVVQLAVTALVVSLVFAATSSTPSVPGAAPSTASIAQLPPTQPGLSSDEGIFLVTNADDGGSAAYFIAGDARHSIVVSDMQVQVQLNPLRPVHAASREEVLGFVEGAPVGSARTGLLSGPEVAEANVEGGAPDAEPVVEQPSVYVVKAGDNLTRVAAEYGTTVDAI